MRRMPHVPVTAAYRERRKHDAYRVALKEMLADGHVPLKGRKVLLELQEQLGLDGKDANRIEAKVLQSLAP